MNTSATRHFRFRRPPAGLLALAVFLSFALPARALTLYSFTIDTTSWAGQNGLLAFDLVGGDSATANNTAFIGSFATNGTLGNSAAISLTDTGFFNETLRNITFGTSLSFDLTLTENHAAPGFDQFSFFVLHPFSFLSLGSTTDPTGAHALFAIDITGHPGGNASVFQSITPGVSWRVAPTTPVSVPEGGSTVLLLAASLATLAWVNLHRRSVHPTTAPASPIGRAV